MSLKTIPQLSPSLWGIATDAMRLYETTKRLKPFRFKPSKLSCVDMIMNLGGERGIRTLDTLLTYTHFPGVLLQPLGHLTIGGG